MVKSARIRRKKWRASTIFFDDIIAGIEKATWIFFQLELCFKQMKDTKFVSFTPIRHFTDSKIAVHSFYCVLVLMLCSVMNLEFHRLGHKLSIDKMLHLMSECEETIGYHIKNKKIIKSYSLTKISGAAKDYCDKYNLYKYALGNPTILQE